MDITQRLDTVVAVRSLLVPGESSVGAGDVYRVRTTDSCVGGRLRQGGEGPA